MAARGVVAPLAFDCRSQARSDVEAGECGHGQGINLPVGEGVAGEGDGFGDALGFAEHGAGEVDAGGVFYEDVELGGAGGGDCEGGLFVAAVESSDEFAVEIDLRVVVELVKDQVAGDGGGDLVAVEDVTVGLIELLHRFGSVGLDGSGEVVPEGSGFGEGDRGMVMTGGGAGTGGRQVRR